MENKKKVIPVRPHRSMENRGTGTDDPFPAEAETPYEEEALPEFGVETYRDGSVKHECWGDRFYE